MKEWLPAMLISLGVAGCGSDGKPSETELTGQLQGGQVQGVEWRTTTHSGVTDANGRFTYLPGETVTFSLGSVELGAVPGSSNITLFTLAGGTPPTTERALRRELDRAMRMSTPFTRAINLDLLLIALDADGDPDNGIDVRNRATALDGVSLQFDQGIAAFGVQLYTRVPSLTLSIPPFKPVAHLYSSLGLRVPVHAPARIVSDTFGGMPGGVQTFSYFTDGLLKSVDDDRNGDGVRDSHSGYEYDDFGRTTHSEDSFDYDLDHVDDQRYTSSYQFDKRGKIIGGEERAIDGSFPSDRTYRLVENVVDEVGLMTRQVIDVDAGSDGSIDTRMILRLDYDAAHGHSVLTTTYDNGSDGVVDRVVRSTEVRDARHRLVSNVIEWDDDANGVIDSRDSDTSVYDDTARTLREVHESDADGDGTPDYRVVYRQQFDRAGNVVAQSSAMEPLADGTIWQAQSITREFDDARRVTKSTRDEDFNGDGVPETRQLDATTYDDIGNVSVMTSDYDYGVDGQTDAHYDEGSEYGASGELLASASHYDLDGDGLTDIRGGTTVENDVVDDGVLLLTNWYFRTRFSGYQ